MKQKLDNIKKVYQLKLKIKIVNNIIKLIEKLDFKIFL